MKKRAKTLGRRIIFIWDGGSGEDWPPQIKEKQKKRVEIILSLGETS
jgi:hypothetical protein